MMLPISEEQIPHPNRDVLHRNIAGESILVPVRNTAAQMDSIYVVNGVAKYVFELIDGQRTVASICSSIVQRYDIHRQAAMADLSDFLDDLQKEGIIRLAVNGDSSESP